MCLSLSDAFPLKTDQSPKSLDLKTSPFILHIPGWCIIASGGGESGWCFNHFCFLSKWLVERICSSELAAAVPCFNMSAAASSSLVAKTFPSSSRCSLRADPAIATSDLMGAFKELFVKEDSRDIRKILSPPPDMDWKSTPQYKWLTRLSPFFMKLLDVAPNTVLTSRKVKDAIIRLHEEGPVNVTRKDDSELWDWVDTKIRIGVSQLRDLKNNVHGCLDRAHKKATSEERNKLCELMKRVNLLKETGGSSEDLGHHTEPTDLVVHRPTTTATPSSSSPVLKSKKKGNEDALSSSPRTVFENILKKKNVRSLDSTTSADPRTPTKMKKKKEKKTRRELSYDEKEDSGKDEGGDAVIKILPAGRKIIKERNKGKAFDSSQPSLFDDLLSMMDGDFFLQRRKDSAIKRKRKRRQKKRRSRSQRSRKRHNIDVVKSMQKTTTSTSKMMVFMMTFLLFLCLHILWKNINAILIRSEL